MTNLRHKLAKESNISHDFTQPQIVFDTTKVHSNINSIMAHDEINKSQITTY